MATPIATAEHSDAPSPIPLPLGRYRLTFEAETPVHLPPFAGSAWRGALGHALKEAVCVTRLTRCEGCLLLRSCVYPYIFETPLPPASERMTRYPTVPHPYVLEAEGGERDKGELLRLGLTLVGRANTHLPYLVHALAQAGQGGVGRGRGRLGLLQVEQEAEPGGGEWHRVHVPGEGLFPLPPAPAPVPPLPERVTLHLTTPLRCQEEGRPVGQDRLAFHHLFRNLLRRVSMLCYFHAEAPCEADFPVLTRASRELTWRHAELRWADLARYSNRQGKHVPLGGVVGTARLEGAGLAPFWPFLWTGQWLHAGKGTTMGMGGYRLVSESLSSLAGDPG